MVVAIFLNVLKVSVKGQVNRNGRCMHTVAILVTMAMRCD